MSSVGSVQYSVVRLSAIEPGLSEDWTLTCTLFQ